MKGEVDQALAKVTMSFFFERTDVYYNPGADCLLIVGKCHPENRIYKHYIETPSCGYFWTRDDLPTSLVYLGGFD